MQEFILTQLIYIIRIVAAGVGLMGGGLVISGEMQGGKTRKLKVVFAVPAEKDRMEMENLIASLPGVRSYEI